MFAKFVSIAAKNMFISSVQSLSKSMGPLGRNSLFAKDVLPLDIRMAENCLFQMKRMLATWGYSKSCIKVETEDGPKRLMVAGREIVQATLKDFQLMLKWSDGEWETWESLQASEELGTIKKEVQDKLDTAKSCATSKGKGKRGPE